MDIGLHQMANIRFVILTRRLRQLPFDVIKIDDCWFIDEVFHQDLKVFLKQGDRLLVSSLRLTIIIKIFTNDFFSMINQRLLIKL